MTALERLLAGVLVLAILTIGGRVAVIHYGDLQYQAGYRAAVAAGQAQHDSEAAAALAIESGLRARQAQQDIDNFTKEQDHAQALEAAQRRVRAGTDRLRCPTAGPVPAPAPAGGGSTAAEPAADGAGPDLVPETAAALLGDGAAIAGLVRRYDQVVQRFDACRAINAR